MADFPSFTHSCGVVPWRFFTRYSAEIATMPREARYSQCGWKWLGEPSTQPPPKKNTMAGRLVGWLGGPAA